MIVTYNEPINKEGFEAHYFNVHIPLAQKMPFVRNVSVHKVKQAMNTNENLYMIVEVEFGNIQELNQALESPEGQEVSGDAVNLMPFLDKAPVIMIVE